jgi:hypothetical protein
MKTNEIEIISWIQNWYHQFCDGNWENNETINIRTIANPGWRITIDLEGTYCENKPFKDTEIEINENEWYICFLRDGKFEGAGGPKNLINILRSFKEWAEEFQKE